MYINHSEIKKYISQIMDIITKAIRQHILIVKSCPYAKKW